MTWQGQLVTTPIGVALVAALWFVLGLPGVFLWALPIAAVAGLLFWVCALAGARVAVGLARATAPRPWQWRQMFALCVGFSTLLLSVPVSVWIGLATVLAPCLIAAGGYLCAMLICSPLEQAIADVARPEAHGN
ncbi:hypothetical protein [Prescottella subtropica]|uniref:hypothetical protein n=1 Tax=Prescottella subtropica TaxID=2545757 RepID=UPI0013A575DE|nr:hypothetical protein [Prescottella subtropica]